MERAGERARDAELVTGVRAGDQLAFGRLYDAWFDRSWDLARRIVRDPDAAADVAQEAMLTAWRRLGELDDPASFGGWLLRITRNRAIDVTRRRQDRPAPEEELAMTAATADRVTSIADPAEVAADRDLADLVWTAADGLADRDAQVLDLSVRQGLEPAEIAVVVGVSRVHAAQLVSRARRRLERALRARVLWREGEPVCPALAGVLEEATVTAFDAVAVEVIDRHARRCGDCEERRRTRLAPAALFAAVPMGAPGMLRRQVAERLAADGVEMGGSSEVGGPGVASPGDADDGGRAGPGRRVSTRRVIAGVLGVAAVLAAVLVWWMADGESEGPERLVSADVVTVPESTSSVPTSTTTEPTTTTTEGTTTTDAVAGPVQTTDAPAPMAPPPAPPPTMATTTTTGPPTDSTGPSVTATHSVAVFDLAFLGVQASATDPSGVSRIEIWFSPSTSGSLSRVKSCAASTCTWRSGGQTVDAEVRYQVRALDSESNWSQGPVRTVVLR